MADNVTSAEMTVDEDQRPRPRGGRRGAAIVGASMLVAAAGGAGFGIGRAVDEPEPSAAGAGASPETVAPATTGDRESGVAPAAPERLPQHESSADDSSADEPTEDVLADVAPIDGAYEIDASGGGGWSVFGDASMKLLTERITDDGIVVRAHLGELWDHAMELGAEVDGWQPPPWCFESGQVRVALGGGERSIIDIGSVSWWTQPFRDRAISWLTLGRVDGDPHRVLFVQAPTGTSEVRATFGDGATDAAVPDDGVAILVVAGAPDTIEHDLGNGQIWYEDVLDVTVDFVGAIDEAGDAVAIDETQIGTWNDPEFAASCSPPPPALPDPGEQPADAVAAEAEIIRLMSGLYGDAADAFEDSLAFIDDPTGVAEARDEVAAGGFAEAAASAEAVVEDLVFTTPADAWFRYRIETASGTFAERYGRAVDLDGTWKITRATICQDLNLAGGSCGGDVMPIRPPVDGSGD